MLWESMTKQVKRGGKKIILHTTLLMILKKERYFLHIRAITKVGVVALPIFMKLKELDISLYEEGELSWFKLEPHVIRSNRK